MCIRDRALFAFNYFNKGADGGGAGGDDTATASTTGEDVNASDIKIDVVGEPIESTQTSNLGAGLSGISVPQINIPGFDQGKITETFGGLTEGLSGISANSSEESIMGLKTKFEEAGSMVDGLNLGSMADGPQKEAVSGMFGGLIAPLKTAVETVYKIPLAKQLLGPTIDGFMQKFAGLGL